jgi:hypothetical protein
MEAAVGVAFFVIWTVLIIMVMNPALFIRLRYRVDIDDKPAENVKPPQNEDDSSLDRYV